MVRRAAREVPGAARLPAPLLQEIRTHQRGPRAQGAPDATVAARARHLERLKIALAGKISSQFEGTSF